MLRPQDELTPRLIKTALLDAEQTVSTAASRKDLVELSRRQTEHLLTRWASSAG